MKQRKSNRVYPSSLLSRQDVIRSILQRELGDEPNTVRPLRKSNPALENAARRHFGTWRAALRAAGLDPEVVSDHRCWSAQRVVRDIQELRRQGVPLNRESAYKVDSGLTRAGCHWFGSWDAALRAAGFDPQPIRLTYPPWTRENLIATIRRRDTQGLPVACHVMVPESATRAGRRLFGSWKAAMRAAGIRNAAVNQVSWSKQLVIDTIRARQEAGKPLNSVAVVREGHALYQAASKYCGSWAAALSEAGIAPATVLRVPPRWTPTRVLDELHRRAQSGMDMVRSSRHPGPLVRAARRCFGCWGRAVALAQGDDVPQERPSHSARGRHGARRSTVPRQLAKGN